MFSIFVVLQVQYLESIPFEALDRAQKYMERARCMFEYSNSERSCSPYAALTATLRDRTVATRDFRASGWNLTSKNINLAV